VRARALAASLLLAAGVPALAQRPLAELTTVQLPPGGALDDALLADLDGDGLDDLALSASFESGARALRLHRARAAAPRYSPEPDALLELTPDVVAYALGDVHADRGREVVLYSAGGVYAWRPLASA
jgi:hypothetical protein